MAFDPAYLLEQFFPLAPYNFDTPPPGQDIGPIKAILTVIGQRLAQFESDELLLLAQVTVQEAAGRYLDLQGILAGVPRYTLPIYEKDDPYRQRILDALASKKLTLPAILSAVQHYYASTRPGALQPTVTTYDLQSDPVDAQANGLVILDFMIDIDFPIPASDAFFAGRSYLGRHDFLVNPYAVITVPHDAGLVMVVLKTKAAGTHPLYRIHNHLVAHE